VREKSRIVTDSEGCRIEVAREGCRIVA
jgi:hypothetical protein